MRLFSILFLISFCCHAQITQINKMEELFPYLECADGSTLVIFDIDLVLIQPSDPAFQMPNIKKHLPFVQSFLKCFSDEQKDIFFSLMVFESPSILIEEKTPCYVQQIIDRGIPTMALTASLTGPLGNIPTIECLKIEHLEGVGIDFAQAAPLCGAHTFHALPSYRGTHTRYVQGILFANGNKKGEVLTHFLTWGDLCPKRVIFIDDLEKNLINVEQALHDFDETILFQGVHYLGSYHFPSEELDEEEFREKWEALAAQVGSS